MNLYEDKFRFLNYNLKKYNWRLLLLVLAATIFGVFVIESAANGYARKQLLGVIVGFVVLIVVSFIDYTFILKFQWPIYIAAVAILVAVLLFGVNVNGARRWFSLGSFGTIQPSEFAKIMMIIVLTRLITDHRDQISRIRTLLMIGVIYMIPVFLIYKEPNLSTTLVYLFIFVTMIFCGGLSYQFIGRVLVFTVPVIGFLVWYIQQPFQILLKGYQLNRILGFLNPSAYQQTTANQQYNSVMAIGSGMITGKGYNNNTFTSVKGGNFISEQQTDFIFSVIGEELGFIGSCITIFLLAAIVFECLKVAKNASNLSGRLIATGVASMIAFQTFVNIGVATNLLPNTGLPLPFISYGLSALLTNMVGIGLVINIDLQKGRR
ncbi:FtsW/RodA/SpoVE family cell cycle protein [Frisingicoccus sp.]|uniref:FtsW/RodA/SpoVE family cell cycle protein n=1 Tax=Frisingicoccus sp. TaxID=1918627 RepID=UPI002ECE48D7|nr:FtsW/RodA/SpoVE family cell cycle protein [Frisingicoccus sp.]